MSTLTDDGVMAVKNAAHQRLLEQRVDIKMKSKKMVDCLNRFHVLLRQRLVRTRTGLFASLQLFWKLVQMLLQGKRTLRMTMEVLGSILQVLRSIIY
jgi:hypothetical protein